VSYDVGRNVLTASYLHQHVPFSKRYFLGGSESLRGWGRLEVGPRTATGVPLGGQSLLMTSGEIRFPVAGRVGGVVFVDAGNIWDRPWQVSRHLHSDAGIGVRYSSPFGLFRLDIGQQLTTVPGLAGERRWRMHFGIGQAF
jgi:outer membrane protein insertion porin family